jgi:tetratricopeptide (TPR) repeat protein
LVEKQNVPEEPKEHDLFKYVTFLSRNKWRIVAGVCFVLAVVVVIGIIQVSRSRSEAKALDAYLNADTAKDYREVHNDYPRSFYGVLSLIEAGNLLYKDGKYSDARREYLRFLEKQPESRLRGWVWNSVGATLEAERKYDEAVEYYRRAEASPWAKLQAKLNLGRCHELKGDSEETLQRAMEQYEIARTYYRQLTETPSAPGEAASVAAWRRQAQERMDFLREKEQQARLKESEKKVDKTNP